MTSARFCGLLFALAVVGCQSPVDHAESDRFSLYLRIVDELTEQPIPGASVRSWGPYDTTIALLEPEKATGLGFRSESDAEGRARVEVSLLSEWPQLPPEDGSPAVSRWKVDWSVSVRRDGYVEVSVAIADQIGRRFITRDELLPEIVVKLKKAAQPGATDNPDDAQRLREDH